MDDSPLQQPIQFVKGVGPQRAELLARLSVHTIADLLFMLPRDILDLPHVTPISALVADEHAQVRGRVVDIDGRPTKNGGTLTGVAVEHNGLYVRALWFNQPWMLQKFRHNDFVLISGKPKRRAGRWEFGSPRVQWLDPDDSQAHGGVLTRYHLTEGLRMDELRRLVRQVVEQYASLVADPLPEAWRDRWQLPSLAAALRWVHLPQTPEQYQQGRNRVVHQDLLEFQLGVALRRRAFHTHAQAPVLPRTSKIDARIRRLFPFSLTSGQDRAISEISEDLASGQAMHRLLQADVGAGKTVVALYALLQTIAAGYQAALMAPTEVLARQHAQTVERYLAHSRVERQLLTGSLTPAERRQALAKIADGSAQLIIGTQALIQKGVQFAKLGLVVIDEQHRFGVRQRARFGEEGRLPHTLVMTATPIPRSLCLTQFGDLDLTLIRDLPPGRQPVSTHCVTQNAQRSKAWDFIQKKLATGRQAYIVCPRIDGRAAPIPPAGQPVPPTQAARSATPPTRPQPPPGPPETSIAPQATAANNPVAGPGPVVAGGPRPQPAMAGPTGGAAVESSEAPAGDSSAARAVYQELSTGVLKAYRVGLLHGQLPPAEKEEVMRRFRDHELDALVCTTVIEVGVDIPNASLLVVLEAERFGLAQLHQLRGRVGRGAHQGYCFLMAGTGPDAEARLEILVKKGTGFEVAEADFQLRGPGDILGSRQHGELPLRSADLIRDEPLLTTTRDAARELVEQGHFDGPDFVPLKIQVLDRFGELMDIAGG
ncbi:MAG: ATP-dependent DNA helicase RecG, partial [Planctomycetaceae bacterium]